MRRDRTADETILRQHNKSYCLSKISKQHPCPETALACAKRTSILGRQSRDLSKRISQQVMESLTPNSSNRVRDEIDNNVLEREKELLREATSNHNKNPLGMTFWNNTSRRTTRWIRSLSSLGIDKTLSKSPNTWSDSEPTSVWHIHTVQ